MIFKPISLGKGATELFFSSTFAPEIRPMHLLYNDWVHFKTIEEEIKKEYEIGLLENNSPSAGENDFNISSNPAKVENNYKEDIKKYIEWSQSEFKYSGAAINSAIRLKNANQLYQERAEEHNSLLDSKRLLPQEQLLDLEIVQLTNDLLLLKQKMAFAEKENLKVSKGLNNYKNAEPKFTISFAIDTKNLVKQINEKRKWIQNQVLYFNNNPFSTEELKTFIVKSRQIIETTGLILENLKFYSAIGRHSRKGTQLIKRSTRLKLTLDRMLDTKLNFIVLGEAGAGKPTSLMMYAYHHKDDENLNVLYMSLGRLVQQWLDQEGGLSDDELIDNLEHGVVNYLKIIGVSLEVYEFVSI